MKIALLPTFTGFFFSPKILEIFFFTQSVYFCQTLLMPIIWLPENDFIDKKSKPKKNLTFFRYPEQMHKKNPKKNYYGQTVANYV